MCYTILHWWGWLNEQKAHVLIESICQCYTVHWQQCGQCLLIISVTVNASAAVNTDRYIQCGWHRISHWTHSVCVVGASVGSAHLSESSVNSLLKLLIPSDALAFFFYRRGKFLTAMCISETCSLPLILRSKLLHVDENTV
jgi:hypothetical protein